MSALILSEPWLLLQVSNGDMTEAVAFLTEKKAQVSHQDRSSYYQTAPVTSDRYISVGSQADTSEQLANIVTVTSFNSNTSKASVRNCGHL